MATKPQPTSKASVNTTLREPVCGMNTYQKTWGGREGKLASNVHKAYGSAPANIPGTPT